MKKLARGVLTLCLIVSTNTALAHAGHDHTHWTSAAVHTFWLGSFALVFAVIVIVCIKQAQKNNIKGQ